jgi:hypothetical protein
MHKNKRLFTGATVSLFLFLQLGSTTGVQAASPKPIDTVDSDIRLPQEDSGSSLYEAVPIGQGYSDSCGASRLLGQRRINAQAADELTAIITRQIDSLRRNALTLEATSAARTQIVTDKCGALDVYVIPSIAEEKQTVGYVIHYSGQWLDSYSAFVNVNDSFVVTGFDEDKRYAKMNPDGNLINLSYEEFNEQMPDGVAQLPVTFFVRPDTEKIFGVQTSMAEEGNGRASTGPTTNFVGCTYLDVAQPAYSGGGSLVYKLHQTKRWCHNDTSYWDVSIGHYVSDTAPGQATQWVAVTENTNFWSFNRSTVTGSFQQCVWWIGCVNSTTWVRIDSVRDGSYSIVGG